MVGLLMTWLDSYHLHRVCNPVARRRGDRRGFASASFRGKSLPFHRHL